MIDVDKVFRFQIGTWVKPVGTELANTDDRWVLTQEMRYRVVSQVLRTARESDNMRIIVSLSYVCSVAGRWGSVYKTNIEFAEHELELSRSYADDPKPETSDA